MQRYILFGFDSYYPSGGMKDFLFGFDTREEFEECFYDGCDYYHILDIVEGRVVTSNHMKSYEIKEWVAETFE